MFTAWMAERTTFPNFTMALLAVAQFVECPPYYEFPGDVEFVREEFGSGYYVKRWNADRSNYLLISGDWRTHVQFRGAK